MVIPMARKKDSSASSRKQNASTDKTHGGIIIPESAKVKPRAGAVTKVSPKRWRKPHIPELSQAKPADDQDKGTAGKHPTPLDGKDARKAVVEEKRGSDSGN